MNKSVITGTGITAITWKPVATDATITEATGAAPTGTGESATHAVTGRGGCKDLPQHGRLRASKWGAQLISDKAPSLPPAFSIVTLTGKPGTNREKQNHLTGINRIYRIKSESYSG